MNTDATPSAERTDRIETYARTDSDGTPELVVYNPGETDEWLKAAPTGVVDLEAYR